MRLFVFPFPFFACLFFGNISIFGIPNIMTVMIMTVMMMMMMMMTAKVNIQLIILLDDNDNGDYIIENDRPKKRKENKLEIFIRKLSFFLQKKKN